MTGTLIKGSALRRAAITQVFKLDSGSKFTQTASIPINQATQADTGNQ